MSRAFFILLQREIAAIVLSPIAYVVFVCFSMLNGYFFYNAAIDFARGSMDVTLIQIFVVKSYWLSFIGLAPILTMRSFSDEYKSGTIELLLTAPVKDFDIILSKFFGVFLFFCFLYATTFFYLIAFQVISGHQIPIFWGPVVLVYVFIFMTGAAAFSVGIFVSSLTKNQVISAFVTLVAMVLFLLLIFLYNRTTNSHYIEFLDYICFAKHLEIFSSGIFDTRPVVLYLSMTVLFLALTQRGMAVRRLKS